MKRLKKYFKNREDAIDILLGKPRSYYTPETFHKLRVEIKKLKALFELLNYCGEEFRQKNIFTPFKLIFRQAGKIRELQVEDLMLKKYISINSITGYRNSLKEQLSQEKRNYFSLLNTTFFTKLKKEYRKAFSYLKQVDKKKVNRYLNDRKNKIEKLLSKNKLKKEDVHELRKQLKTYNYNLKIKDPEKQIKSAQKKDALPELLGMWHDCEVTISHLTKVIGSGALRSKETNQLEKINAKIAADEQHLFNKINAALTSKNKPV